MGRPKKFERTLKIALTEEQWERLDLEAIIMRVPIAEAVRMNIEVGLMSTTTREETSDA
ncbi:hypothetical protein [Actinomycetospora cinnamomea]|uniref:CopG antitoxin of type II toxin-antitoxin system n=1 Tax=Actinomycetospora cinnamomea TaxID=663609 RepID=A0A2U1FD67_9PSEU|nr:hypothetical protein [Actinomycetospora cinnamomea]PVZ10151.1 hypothetical protein C8D89_105228 [Actinomycetospora cinnamomea]